MKVFVILLRVGGVLAQKEHLLLKEVKVEKADGVHLLDGHHLPKEIPVAREAKVARVGGLHLLKVHLQVAMEVKVEMEAMEAVEETPQLKHLLILMKNPLTQPNVPMPTKADVNVEMNPKGSPPTLFGNLMSKDASPFTNPWTEQDKYYQLSLLQIVMPQTNYQALKERVPFPKATKLLLGMVLPGLASPPLTIIGNLVTITSSMMTNLCLALMMTVKILLMSGKSLSSWKVILNNLMPPGCGLKDSLRTPCFQLTLVSVSLTKS